MRFRAEGAGARPEGEYVLSPLPALAAEVALPWYERLGQHAAVRKTLILLALALLWEAAARYTDNDLLLPGAWQTAQAFAQGLLDGELPARAFQSLVVLLK